MLSKETIEDLTDNEVLTLLNKKWINPLIENIQSMPNSIISDFAGKIESLAKKYDNTLADIETEIQETEQSLIGMIDELTGSESDMKGLIEFKKLLGGE